MHSNKAQGAAKRKSRAVMGTPGETIGRVQSLFIIANSVPNRGNMTP